MQEDVRITEQLKFPFFIIQANSSSSAPFLSLLDDVALNLRLNRTVSSKNDSIRMYSIYSYSESMCYD